MALNEITMNVSRDVIAEANSSFFISIIRSCLSDPEKSVRDAAGQALNLFIV